MPSYFSRLLLGLSLLAACSELDDPPLYVETDYQVRCLRCEPRAPDDEVRRIAAINGEFSLNMNCSVREGATRTLNFSIEFADGESNSDDYSLEFFQLALDGDDPGRDCSVGVREGSNSYEGDCTRDEPSDEEPCQVLLEEDGGIISGTLWCRNISSRADPTRQRHVVQPGTSDEPIELEIHGCRGL